MNVIVKIDKYPFSKIFTLDNDTFIQHYFQNNDIYGKKSELKIKTRRGRNTSEGIRLGFIYK